MVNHFDNVNKFKRNDYHSVYTIQLCELLDGKLFSWEREPLKSAFDLLDGLNGNIKPRLQTMFIERNYWREISMIPYLEWVQQVAYKVKFELCPKYLPMYKAIANDDFDPMHSGDEYFKERNIDSSFPETLLSGNGADYASSGSDREYQRIQTGNAIEIASSYYNVYKDIDTAFIDELDSFFIDLYSANANTW